MCQKPKCFNSITSSFEKLLPSLHVTSDHWPWSGSTFFENLCVVCVSLYNSATCTIVMKALNEQYKMLTATSSASPWHGRPLRFQSHVAPFYGNFTGYLLKKRIEDKILTLAWKTLSGLAPSYLVELFNDYVNIRTIESSDSSTLAIQQPNLRLQATDP